MQQLTREDKLAAYRRLYDSRREYVKRLKIKTRDQRVIPFAINEAQHRLYLQIEGQEAAGKPVRGVGLKPRRVGLSTAIQGAIFHRGATHPNINGLTVAHDLDSATEIFAMSGLFYDSLPPSLRPQTRYSSRKELLFENPDADTRPMRPGLRSKLSVATANDEELGRSKEVGLLHCSEVAFWKGDPAATLLAVKNSVDYNSGTMIFLESTPNGFGNQFHKEYEAAKQKYSDYFPYFMAWFEFQNYRRPIDEPEEFADSIDDTERDLLASYPIDHEQLNWRRWAIRELCNRNADKFAQEYPSNDIECFLLSGRRRFDMKLLHNLLMAAREPTAVGYLTESGSLVKFEPNQDGYVKIWEPPLLSKRYVVGADVAEGLEIKSGDAFDGDFSVGHVYDVDTQQMVAEWHGHIEPEMFGDEIAKLGRIYNQALIACESNNHGHVTNQRLKNLGYTELYWHREDDKRGAKINAKLGWPTNVKTKKQAIDALAVALADGADIPSRETIGEMMSYVIDAKGATNGEEGCHDDRVMASAIAIIASTKSGIETIFPALRAS